MSHQFLVSGNQARSQSTSTAAPVAPTRVLLVGIPPTMLPVLRTAIEQDDSLTVVGRADGVDKMRETAVSLDPHVILLDLSMNEVAGLADIAAFCQHPPSSHKRSWPPALLVLSAYCDREYICRLFAIGVKGYLLVDEPAAQIAAGLKAITTSNLVLSSSAQASLQSPHRQSPFLSVRATHLLTYVARGYTNDEIARLYKQETGEIDRQLHALFQRLPGVTTRSDAVSWAWEHGITLLPP